MVDVSDSMEKWIRSVQNQCINISNELNSKYPLVSFNFGAIFYRDPIDSPSDKHDLIQLTDDVIDLKNKIEGIKAYGGGDDPEDWVGAYNLAIDSIAWRNGTRLIIHIADSPAHGIDFCLQDKHNEENAKLPPLIKTVAEKNIKIYAFQVKNSAELSFNKCSELYKSYGGTMFLIKDFNSFSEKEIFDNFNDSIIEAVICAAPKDI